jgi:uncharacterized protein
MIRKLVLSLLAVLPCAAAAHAVGSEMPHVTVYGTAVTKVVPDQMVWNLAIRNKGAQLSDVAQRHAQIVEHVLGFLKQSGVKAADVQTAEMTFGENWQYRDNSRVMEGYFASTAVSFRTSDLQAYKPLWLGLAQIPEVSIDSVGYDHSKRIDYQNETRRNALMEAKKKAADLAKTLGAEIGEPLSIEEDLTVDDWWKSPTNNRANNVSQQESSTTPTDLAPGRIPIRMRVKVSFRLISPKS